mgnify:FL=1
MRWTRIPPGRSPHRFRKDLKNNFSLLLMLLPSVLFFLLFAYLPMFGIVLAFERYNFRDRFFSPFVGLDNFRFLFSYQDVLSVIRNTVLYNLAFIAVNSVLQITCAVMLSQLMGKWFKKITQSVLFFPYFISWVVVGAFAYNLMNYNNGLLTTLTGMHGGDKFDFYNTPVVWPFVLIIAGAWKSLGYGTIVYLAAIMGLDQEMYEAGTIDGANVFQKIRFITLPCLIPTFIILVLLSLGSIFRGNFEMFYQLVGNNAILLPITDVVDTYVTRALLQSSDVGMASAAGLVQSGSGFIIILFVNYLVRRYNSSYALF